MNDVTKNEKLQLIEMAHQWTEEFYGKRKILPCGGKIHLEDCFTKDEGNIIFWFDILMENNKTHSSIVSLSQTDSDVSNREITKNENSNREFTDKLFTDRNIDLLIVTLIFFLTYILISHTI